MNTALDEIVWARKGGCDAWPGKIIMSGPTAVKVGSSPVAVACLSCLQVHLFPYSSKRFGEYSPLEIIPFLAGLQLHHSKHLKCKALDEAVAAATMAWNHKHQSMPPLASARALEKNVSLQSDVHEVDVPGQNLCGAIVAEALESERKGPNPPGPKVSDIPVPVLTSQMVDEYYKYVGDRDPSCEPGTPNPDLDWIEGFPIVSEVVEGGIYSGKGKPKVQAPEAEEAKKADGQLCRPRSGDSEDAWCDACSSKECRCKALKQEARDSEVDGSAQWDAYYHKLLLWRDDPSGGAGMHVNVPKYSKHGDLYEYQGLKLGAWLQQQKAASKGESVSTQICSD